MYSDGSRGVAKVLASQPFPADHILVVRLAPDRRWVRQRIEVVSFWRGALGRPYAEEVSRLAETYNWALSIPVDAFSIAVRSASSHPLVAVGSGGSYTTAHYAAAANRQYTSGFASAMTPLEAVSTPQTAPEFVGPVVDGR